MDAATAADISAFHEEVSKEIITEAPSDAWHQPQPDDLVILEYQGPAGANRCSRAWRVGSTGAPPLVAGLNLDLCVRTMRRGECSTMRSKKLEDASPVTLQLHSLEHSEDMFGDGCVTRTVLEGGKGWQTPQPGSEVIVRFGWHSMDEAANPGTAQNGEHAPLEAESLAAAEEAAEEATSDGVATEILLGGSTESIATLMMSRALKDLQRLLLARLHGAVVARATHIGDGADSASIAASEGVVLKVVSASGKELVSDVAGMSPVAALEKLRGLVGPAPGAAGRKPREVVVTIEEDGCSCDAEDWIPGKYGMRILSDLRTGQRCLVHLSSDVGQGKAMGKLEYDIELLKIIKLEDISLDKQGKLVKKLMYEGNGYERPTDGAEVTLRVEACDESSGADLLESRELQFSAASGRFCTAIDETVLTMKKDQVCEVRCSDPTALVDDELQLHKANRAVVTLTIELLSFEKIDINALEEPERVAHCTRRKEVGTTFFQNGSWRRALKRYQHVTSLLAYVDHWKEENCKTTAVMLRRTCHLNAAACWLKLEVWPEADQSCKQVLREDPGNVKALFRRGQALNNLGEYREAGQIIRRVLEIDPDNKEAQRMLARLRQAAKAEAQQQKGMFSRMAKGIVEDSSADATGVAAGEDARSGEAVQAAAAGGGSGSQAVVAEEEEDDSIPLWCWGLASVLLLGSTLGVVAYMRRRR